MDQKARINLIHVTGLGRTKDAVTTKILEKVFDSKTIKEIVNNASESRNQLLSLGLKAVDFEIDTSKGPDISDFDYDLKFNIKEHKRLTGGIFTSIGNNNSGKLNVQLTAPNFLGAGEKASIGFEKNVLNKESSVFFDLSKPLAPWLKNQPKINLSSYQTLQSSYVSSFDLVNRGIDFEFFYRINNYLSHKISMQNVWREIKPMNRETPIKIREEAGHNLKASLKNELRYDSRNDSAFISKGLLINLIQEYAGLYGNVGFLKQDLELSLFKKVPYYNSLVLQSFFKVGFMKKFENCVVCINDKYFLGGPLNLRGFNHHGIGPKNLKCPLGGTSMWLSGIHLLSPLPFIKSNWSKLFRLQFFVNAGNIVDTNENNVNIYDYKMINLLTNNVRVSCGAGILVGLSNNSKIELNYSFPLKSQSSDITENLQFGIGLTFY